MAHDDNNYTVVPPVEILLNTSACICAAVTHIANNGPSTEADCKTNSNCNGLECIVEVPDQGLIIIEFTVEPCIDPPGFAYTISDGDGVVNEQGIVNKNKSIDLPGVFKLLITVEHTKFSVILHVSCFLVEN